MAKTNYITAKAPDTEDVTFYQSLYRGCMQAYAVLRVEFTKGNLHRSASPAKKLRSDALWEGAWRCKTAAQTYVETALDRGVILTMFMPD